MCHPNPSSTRTDTLLPYTTLFRSDGYGTLIEWESVMFAPLSGRTSRAVTLRTGDEIPQAHARHESRQQAQTPTKPYRDLLPIVYKRLAEEWGVSVTNAECEDYGRSVRDWPE